MSRTRICIRDLPKTTSHPITSFLMRSYISTLGSGHATPPSNAFQEIQRPELLSSILPTHSIVRYQTCKPPLVGIPPVQCGAKA
ncbi:hypothetical protein MJO28_006609 [Puccinia striiformis f. sp. tritici]|uniref:Uncharacterized protein n=1 Tax=Puccinia striiformis f. sp. tritici TaxID=168172 RepID=A0ACC0EHC4_9BASI|nr:hypothetical protein MJO28_006609 [Puccinia striiformis f. sp. tritici]